MTSRRTGLLAAMLITVACDEGRMPIAPSPPPASSPSAPYTISGVVTAFHGGPIEAVRVIAKAIPIGASVETQTDAQGHYTLPGPAAAQVVVFVSSPPDASVSFFTESRGGLSPQDQTVDFVLHRILTFPLGGDDTISGTIYGDEVMPDTLFGGRCVSVACVLVDLNGAPGAELTLSWSDPSYELVLYEPGDYTSPGSPGSRVCCGSPLSTVFHPDEVSVIAIGFESVRGARPGPNDSQTFQLTARRRQ